MRQKRKHEETFLSSDNISRDIKGQISLILSVVQLGKVILDKISYIFEAGMIATPSSKEQQKDHLGKIYLIPF